MLVTVQGRRPSCAAQVTELTVDLRGQDRRRRLRGDDDHGRGRARASSTRSATCVKPFGIVELQRTGRIALPKLARQPAKLRAVKTARA